MEKIQIEATKVTPMVCFDPKQGVIEFKGISSPENSLGFYQHIFITLDEFLSWENKEIVANLSFIYFNTSSSKCLFDVLKKLSMVRTSGRELTINWFYEEDDEDMREVGEDYSNVLNLDFNFIKFSA